MPFSLVLIGLLLVVTGTRDTHVQFGQMLVKDFTGPGNFVYWLAAIGFIGALGYNEALRPFSRMFLFLIIIGMVIRNGGVFDKFNAALKAGPAPVGPANDNGTAPGPARGLGGLPGFPSVPSFPSVPGFPTGPGGLGVSDVVNGASKLANFFG